MARKKLPAGNYKPGVYVGRHPDTGVIHRLTITVDGKIKIERQPYVSDNPDGWTKTYPDLHCEVSKHDFLILKILNNPAEWPG